MSDVMVYQKSIKKFSFGDLDEKDLIDTFKDGRIVHGLLVKMIPKWFPWMKFSRVIGEPYVTYRDGEDNFKYLVRIFTSHLTVLPSKQVGYGRETDLKEAKFLARNTMLIVCDVDNFPQIRCRFVEAAKIYRDFENGYVSGKYKEEFFGAS